jgi:hypothetical protein
MSRLAGLLLVVVFLTACVFVGTSTSASAEMTENSWVSKAPMQQARANLGVATVNGKIYAIGGIVLKYQDHSRRESVEVATNEEYDPATDTWTTKTPIPTESGGCFGVLNDKIYVVGSKFDQGYYDELDHYVPGNKTVFTQIYNPATESWSTGASPPIFFYVSSGGVTTGVMAPRRMYVFTNSQTFPDIYINQVYDPKTDSWASGAAVPTSREGFATAVADDLIYVIGGYVNTYPDAASLGTGGVTTFFATVEQYTPFGYGTPDPSYSTTPNSNDASEPFPVVPVVAASGASVAVVGVCLLVYFKKRHR